MWIYNNEEITKETFPKDAMGFVYIMGAVINGEKKFYIGKKTVYSQRKVKLGKRELEARPTKAHKDWKWKDHFEPFENYFSSNDVLKKAHQDGIQIKRVILQFCSSKAELTFEETRHLFRADVLKDKRFLNDNILGKFYRSTLYPVIEAHTTATTVYLLPGN